MQMEDQAMDAQAEAELQKLEERLGLAEKPVETTVEQPKVADDVDSQLAELEKRIEQSPG